MKLRGWKECNEGKRFWFRLLVACTLIDRVEKEKKKGKRKITN